MSGKRKRNNNEDIEYRKVTSKTTINESLALTASKPVQHSTLRLYYSHITSLTQYLQSRLSSSASTARLRRLSTFGNDLFDPLAHEGIPKSSRQEARYDSDKLLRSLLDRTLVCYEQRALLAENAALENDYVTFSQQSLITTRSSIEEGTASQTEVSAMSL